MVARLLSPILVFALLFTATARFYARASSRQEQGWAQVVEQMQRRQVLFLGDSHVQYGIDDRLDSRIANLATPNELYVLTLAKTRRLRPRVAVVGVWIHSFLPYYEKRLGRVLAANYDVAWGQLLPDERGELLRHSGFEEAAFIRARGLVPFLGRGLPSTWRDPRASLGSFAERGPSAGIFPHQVRRRFREMAETAEPFPLPLQASFLRTLLTELRSSGCEVVLLATPVCDGLREAVDQEWGPRYRELLGGLVRDFHARLWDESARPLPGDDFRDPDHLSARGARRLTRMLVRRLEDEGLLVNEAKAPADPAASAGPP